MVRTQIQLPERQAAALKKMAAQRQVSMAELIRGAVDALIRSGGAVDGEERKRRALAAVGKYGSGRRDVSRDHDKHLGEAFVK